MYLLDTDHLSLLERGGAESLPLQRRLEPIPAEEIATTIITYEEQTRGWLAQVARARTVAQQIKAYAKLSKHLETYRNLTVLDFDEEAAVRFQELRRSRVRIGSMDLKIAAIALANDAVLVTRNLVDFRKVPRLAAEMERLRRKARVSLKALGGPAREG